MLLEGLLVIQLGAISFQDIKDREVYWFFFPIVSMILGYIHYSKVEWINFQNAILINLVLLSIILSILYLYTRIRIKKSFFKEVFGLGDLLFFVALGIGFPTITFIILFTFSIIFSLIVWMLFKNKRKHNTVPLAGYMSIFLMIVLMANWIFKASNLYMI